MKATQYITGVELPFVRRDLYPSAGMSGAITVSVKDAILSRDFLGFGVAVTGSSCHELNAMEQDARAALLRQIYTADGLNLSVARLTVGSSDYSAELYSYDDVENDLSLAHFSVDRDRAYIIPMIQEILKVRPDLYLYASPWSPPAWMKTGGSLCGGYMRREYIGCYADYLIRYLKEYEKCGIRIRALTPQNEPETQQHGLMPACIWHPDVEAEFVSVLRKKLDDERMDVKIWMYDHNFDGVSRVMWMLEHHKQLPQICDGLAFHYYNGGIERTEALRKAYPDLNLYFTEGGPRLLDHYATDWCKWGTMMAKVLNNGFSSFTGWNLLLDETGGPNIGPYFCGGLVTRNSASGALSRSGQYQAFRHFSHFFRQGAVVLQTDVTGNEACLFRFPAAEKDITVTAFQNPDGSRFVVLINPDPSAKKQVQLRVGTDNWYVELLPDTLSTVVLEDRERKGAE